MNHIEGGESWQPYPLFGGEMISIAGDPVDPQTIYVGTRDAGVFKTIDGGQTWLPARDGLTFFPIRSLVVDPTHPVRRDGLRRRQPALHIDIRSPR